MKAMSTFIVLQADKPFVKYAPNHSSKLALKESVDMKDLPDLPDRCFYALDTISARLVFPVVWWVGDVMPATELPSSALSLDLMTLSGQSGAVMRWEGGGNIYTALTTQTLWTQRI